LIVISSGIIVFIIFCEDMAPTDWTFFFLLESHFEALSVKDVTLMATKPSYLIFVIEVLQTDHAL